MKRKIEILISKTEDKYIQGTQMVCPEKYMSDTKSQETKNVEIDQCTKEEKISSNRKYLRSKERRRTYIGLDLNKIQS